MKTLLFAGVVCLFVAGCADQAKIQPVNPGVPYENQRGPGAIGSPPIQQGSLPTHR